MRTHVWTAPKVRRRNCRQFLEQSICGEFAQFPQAIYQSKGCLQNLVSLNSRNFRYRFDCRRRRVADIAGSPGDAGTTAPSAKSGLPGSHIENLSISQVIVNHVFRSRRWRMGNKQAPVVGVEAFGVLNSNDFFGSTAAAQDRERGSPLRYDLPDKAVGSATLGGQGRRKRRACTLRPQCGAPRLRGVRVRRKSI